MAFFKFRKSGDEAPVAPAQGESIEALRKRATFRLIGAAVLVLAGVIGFPLVFDSQPRPVAVDIKIEIPDKAQVKPLALPSHAGASSAGEVVAAPAAAPPTSTTLPAPSAPARPSPVAVAPLASEKINESVVSKENSALRLEKSIDSATKNDSNSTKKQANLESKSDLQNKNKPDDGAKALALLEGKTAEKPAAEKSAATTTATEGRFVVQVGAFSDATRAREARAKLESAGLKTYTQVVETKEGARTRVRVGPFSDKAEADRAAQKVKSLDLPAAILSL